jgi:UDP-N-acetylmuramoylalanine--D-glutamate ligase
VITSPAFRGKRYAVLGLARSGVATVEALLASGAEVAAWDSREEARAAVSGVTFADPLEIDLAGFDGVVVSPGVPLNRHPIAGHARKAGVPVIGDIELFALARPTLPPHKVVGITGTNGKSTTTALIHHILETAGVPTLMGGNIGLPILSQDPLPAGGVYVLELSSYQIDLTFSLDCDVAVLTNITPDHLDRYDGFEGYKASKLRLFAMQSLTNVAVFAGEDSPTYYAYQRRWFEIHDTTIMAPGEHLQGQENWPSLQGPHNAQNAACAIATCKALGLTDDQIEQGLRTYPGLPHRMERVAEKGGVLYVNDSKATNATATAPALAAYPKIHWILGGIPKTDDLDDCAPFFGHVLAGYTIGQAGPMFADILRRAGKPVTESGTLAQAVNDAAAAASPGEVVMLSPACASFDQFKDYEARGEAFRAAVGAL